MMKNINRNKFLGLLFVAGGLCGFFAGCDDDINDNAKTTGAEASNKVYVGEKYASLAFDVNRSIDGKVTNMDTLVTKLVVNCTSPAGNDLKVKVALDTLLVDVYNKKHGTSYRKIMSKWVKLDKSSLTIPEGATESEDTLTISLLRPLDSSDFSSLDGYIMPIQLVSASGYDAQVDYSKRVSYLTLNIIQENGIGFEEGKNNVTVKGNAGFTGCDLPLIAFLPPANEVTVGLEVDNSLVAGFNSKYGTNFKTLSTNDLNVPSSITWPVGDDTYTASLAYTGDATALSGNYLVPIKIKSVTSAGADEIKALKTDIYYLVVDCAKGELSFEADHSFGVQQTDKSAYKVIAPNITPFMGSWSGILGSGGIMVRETASFTIDLGSEIQNIAGISFQYYNMAPKGFDISYGGENLYNDLSMSVSLGNIAISSNNINVKFAQPVTARYLGFNDIVLNMGFWGLCQFYIYTQE